MKITITTSAKSIEIDTDGAAEVLIDGDEVRVRQRESVTIEGADAGRVIRFGKLSIGAEGAGHG